MLTSNPNLLTRSLSVIAFALAAPLAACTAGSGPTSIAVPLSIGKAAAAGVAKSTSTPFQSTPLKWLMTSQQLALIVNSPYAIAKMSDSGSFVAGSVPSGWVANKTAIFTSYAGMLQAFNQGQVGPSIAAVLYDSEPWQYTPLTEQQNLVHYTQLAEQLAHANGKLFIVAPVPLNLWQQTSPPYQWILDHNIPGDCARYADIYEIQAQGSELNPANYVGYVQGATEQARAANPNVLVFAGASTAPSGKDVTVPQLTGVMNAVESTVDGFWLNIPQRGPYCPKCGPAKPGTAIGALKNLAPR